MKKKILILVLIIIVSFCVGIIVHTTKTHIENKKIEEQYRIFTGVVENIENDRAIVIPEDESLKSGYDKIQFSIPEDSEFYLEIGDRLEIKFLHGHISENGSIENPILEYLGKGRLFDNVANIPVSNSGYTAANYVFKSFYVYNNNLKIDEFTNKDNFYLKKIISYEEYLKFKELMPDIRALTENDFVNYYLLIALSSNLDYVYTLEEPKVSENSLDLNILQNKSLSRPTSETTPTYSGVSIVVPNSSDFEIENINLITKSTAK